MEMMPSFHHSRPRNRHTLTHSANSRQSVSADVTISEGLFEEKKEKKEKIQQTGKDPAPCRDIGMIRRLEHRTRGTTSAIGVASARASSIDGVPPPAYPLQTRVRVPMSWLATNSNRNSRRGM